MNISGHFVTKSIEPLPGGIEDLDDSLFDMYDSDSDVRHHIVPHPRDLRRDRVREWPEVHDWANSNDLIRIYDCVRRTGLPNMIGARITVPSQLKIPAWHSIATGHPDDDYVLKGIQFGFPLHYTGPPLARPNKVSHSSADRYLSQVQHYVKTETLNKAMLGPYVTSPFVEWTNFSPIMTRPKDQPHKRRIIVDLSYPQGNNVNAFVYKNTVFGEYWEHRLPTVQDTVTAMQAMGYRVMLATIDIERAYRNVPVCPLDLPLLGIEVDGKVYIDAAMPFGARNSSLNMQRIAQFLVRALEVRNISCQMYLDDMVLQLSDKQDFHARFREVTALYRYLGLPISYSKIQPPAEVVTYLGICIDVPNRTLSMPPTKLRDLVDLMTWVMKQEKVSKRIVQTLVGKINHVARCVHPARLFMSRILQALRDAHHDDHVSVRSMRPDLHWFRLFEPSIMVPQS